MGRLVMAMVAAGLLCLSAGNARAGDQEQPAPIQGKWEAPASWADKGGNGIQTLEMKDGKLTWIEPRIEGDRTKKSGFRIEAEYTVSKSGRVYAVITLAGGATEADDGDVFSFIPKIDGGILKMDDYRGTYPLEGPKGKVQWGKKP